MGILLNLAQPICCFVHKLNSHVSPAHVIKPSPAHNSHTQPNLITKRLVRIKTFVRKLY
jgi:hypothetical protein